MGYSTSITTHDLIMECTGMDLKSRLAEKGIDYLGLKQIILREAIEDKEVLPYAESLIENYESQDEINRLTMLFVSEMLNSGSKPSDLKEALDGAKSYLIQYQAEKMKACLNE